MHARTDKALPPQTLKVGKTGLHTEECSAVLRHTRFVALPEKLERPDCENTGASLPDSTREEAPTGAAASIGGADGCSDAAGAGAGATLPSAIAGCGAGPSGLSSRRGLNRGDDATTSRPPAAGETSESVSSPPTQASSCSAASETLPSPLSATRKLSLRRHVPQCQSRVVQLMCRVQPAFGAHPQLSATKARSRTPTPGLKDVGASGVVHHLHAFVRLPRGVLGGQDSRQVAVPLDGSGTGRQGRVQASDGCPGHCGGRCTRTSAMHAS